MRCTLIHYYLSYVINSAVRYTLCGLKKGISTPTYYAVGRMGCGIWGEVVGLRGSDGEEVSHASRSK